MPSHKSYNRMDRISAQLRRDIGELVHEAVREHGIASVSVSDVEVTRDLAHAKIFVTALDPETSAQAVKDLKELAKEFRYQLGKRMKIRSLPELHFVYDDSVDRGERIENLLRSPGVAAVSSEAPDDGDDADQAESPDDQDDEASGDSSTR
jgi:ribosome-binding factor A